MFLDPVKNELLRRVNVISTVLRYQAAEIQGDISQLIDETVSKYEKVKERIQISIEEQKNGFEEILKGL